MRSRWKGWVYPDELFFRPPGDPMRVGEVSKFSKNQLELKANFYIPRYLAGNRVRVYNGRQFISYKLRNYRNRFGTRFGELFSSKKRGVTIHLTKRHVKKQRVGVNSRSVKKK